MTEPTTYTPREGSLADRVIKYFAANPDEELTRRDLSDKFECAQAGVDTSLDGAVRAGLLATCNNDEMVRVWVAGTALSKKPKPARETAPAVKRAVQSRMPEVDITTLVVRADHPRPIRGNAVKGSTRYDAAFDKLTKPGQSFLLPKPYYGAVTKAAQMYGKRTGRVVKVHHVDASHVGVWRVS